MKCRYEIILTWSFNCPKELPFSVKSSSTNVIVVLKHYSEEKLCSSDVRNIGCQNMWIDTHLLEMKIDATYGTKDDLVSSHIQGAPSLKQRPSVATKFLLRVVAT
jgi:hypothetical protein